METTRQRIADALREGPHTASDLGEALSLPTPAVYEHLDHVSRSVEEGAGGDEAFLVSPPTCRDCGFDDFDDLVNEPSRCPACRSERVSEPTFVIR